MDRLPRRARGAAAEAKPIGALGQGHVRRILGPDARSPRRPEPRAGGGRHARGRPARRARGGGDRPDAHDRAPLRVAGGAGHPRGEPARAHVLAARRGGPPGADRGAPRGALRGAPRGDVPLLLPAPAPGRGARGGRGPVPHAGDPRGPAGAPARPNRRPLAARARDPRQPGAAPRELRLPHRRAEARDGLRGRVPRLRRAPHAGGRGRRRAGPCRARARVREHLRGPRPPARRARGARPRRPGAARVRPPARAPARARARVRLASGTCWWTSTRRRTSRRGCCSSS